MFPNAILGSFSSLGGTVAVSKLVPTWMMCRASVKSAAAAYRSASSRSRDDDIEKKTQGKMFVAETFFVVRLLPFFDARVGFGGRRWTSQELARAEEATQRRREGAGADALLSTGRRRRRRASSPLSSSERERESRAPKKSGGEFFSPPSLSLALGSHFARFFQTSSPNHVLPQAPAPPGGVRPGRGQEGPLARPHGDGRNRAGQLP